MLLAFLLLSTGLAASVEDVLVSELDRARSAWAAGPQPVHYAALQVEDHRTLDVVALAGTLASSEVGRSRTLDVDLRVGTPDLDSTHPLRGMSAWTDSTRDRLRIPFEDEPTHALRQAVWAELDARYREARNRIGIVRANLSVKVEEETQAPDFEPRAKVEDRQPIRWVALESVPWEGRLARVSARMDADPRVHVARASLQVEQVQKTFVDTEGSRLVHGGTWVRLSLLAGTVAPDGDDLSAERTLSFRSLEGLPSEARLIDLAGRLVDELGALLDAPRGEPYRGPVILDARAAAVFFHEVLGHRVEGHRQKRDDEGKTFAEKVGRPILPAFLDVWDDPSTTRYAGEDLNGAYPWDDEGVPATRAVLVEKGIFRGFLTNRSPIPGFPTSNGHGRRMAGHAPVARMGNTVVEARGAVSAARLIDRLKQEARRQGLPYGIVVEEIEGGFTTTGRVTPNAFNVRATRSRRVYVDGRPDERVRGIDLVGTPLLAFSSILAAGDDPGVFNGLCGAESGWVPVSAVAPSLLFRTLEFQRKEKGEDRPPLLPRPQAGGGDP
ncbi:MAG: TldD/PmbA family protein [Deltaproteobacteria bacterium]|nr:TldD/PmbA family protein [Deltaproteobacteria bacterium]